MNPNVDNSLEKFKWSKPDFDKLRNYCTEIFNWDEPKIKEFLDPLEKVYKDK